MRIILATHNFRYPGGSETYLLTVADQLIRLGHEATIFSNHLGQMAEAALARGITVAPELEDLPATADVILSQDGIVAHALSERLPTTPQVFVCHSTQFELQSPPAIPGLVSVVVVLSDRFEKRVRALDTSHKVVRMRQPIDVDRLLPRGAPRKRPEKALLLGNYLRGEQRRLLVETWSDVGIEVVQVGYTAGRFSMHPEDDIAQADIVIGKGRAILDAMSCGRPAYVYDVFGTDGWVIPDAYPAMEADAFAGLASTHVFDLDRLRCDLKAYDPHMGYANRELIVTHHHARLHAEQLVTLFRDIAPLAVPYATPKRELVRLIKSKWQAEAELSMLRNDIAQINDRATLAVQETAKAIQESASLAVKNDELIREVSALRAELSDAATKRDVFERSRRVRMGLAFGGASDALRAVLKRKK